MLLLAEVPLQLAQMCCHQSEGPDRRVLRILLTPGGQFVKDGAGQFDQPLGHGYP
jgi:hypothetical protein